MGLNLELEFPLGSFLLAEDTALRQELLCVAEWHHQRCGFRISPPMAGRSSLKDEHLFLNKGLLPSPSL